MPVYSFMSSVKHCLFGNDCIIDFQFTILTARICYILFLLSVSTYPWIWMSGLSEHDGYWSLWWGSHHSHIYLTTLKFYFNFFLSFFPTLCVVIFLYLVVWADFWSCILWYIIDLVMVHHFHSIITSDHQPKIFYIFGSWLAICVNYFVNCTI